MAFTDYLENKLLAHTFSNTAYTSPSTVYVALYTVAPTDSTVLAQRSRAAATCGSQRALQQPPAIQRTQAPSSGQPPQPIMEPWLR